MLIPRSKKMRAAPDDMIGITGTVAMSGVPDRDGAVLHAQALASLETALSDKPDVLVEEDPNMIVGRVVYARIEGNRLNIAANVDRALTDGNWAWEIDYTPDKSHHNGEVKVITHATLNSISMVRRGGVEHRPDLITDELAEAVTTSKPKGA